MTYYRVRMIAYTLLRPDVNASTVTNFLDLSLAGEPLNVSLAKWLDPAELLIETNEVVSKEDIARISVRLVLKMQRLRHRASEQAFRSMDHGNNTVWEHRSRIRMLDTGRIIARLLSLEDNHVVDEHTIEVRDCDGDAQVLSLRPTELDNQNFLSVPAAIMTWPSVAAAGNHGGIRISNSYLPQAAAQPQAGAWSVSMWLFLLERASAENFGSLLFKGTGQDQLRTPSIWMLPGGRQVCLRLSTVLAADAGADADWHVPLRQWTHVLVQVVNSSSLDEYLINIYQNGEFAAGITVNDHESVVHNTGPLWIGKDPSFAGSPILIGDLQLRDQELTSDQIKKVFQEATIKTSDAVGAPSDAAVTVFQSVQAATGALFEAAEERQNVASTGEAELSDAFETAMQMLGDCDETDISAIASLLALACDEGAGLGSACREYGLLFLQPSRTACQKEVKVYAVEHGLTPQTVLSGLLDGAHAARTDHGTAAKPGAEGASSRTLFPRDTIAARKYIRLAATMLDAKGVYYWGLLTMYSIGTSHAGDSKLFHDHLLALTGGSSTGSVGIVESSSNVALTAAVAGTRHNQRPGKGSTGAHGSDTHAGIGLFHIAAALGEPRAWAALAWRYEEGYQVPQHERTAAMYYEWTSRAASDAFYVRGQQPLHEIMRLNMDTIDWVEYGQRGDEDEVLQMLVLQAEQGHLESQVTLAELYYWGARGMERDQAAAAQYWDMAAAQGDVPSMSALGGLYLKGEGVEQSNETALYWFEKAAEHEHVRALNGLGAMYFQANGVERNYTKAFHYLERAAATRQDGDSMFNLAHCYREGQGTNQSWEKATAWLHDAAREFGHFGAITTLGDLYATGSHLPESQTAAISYFKAAAAMGEWGGIMRKGFDRYLARDYTGAVLDYLEAFALGQEAGASNAAYLLDRKMASWAEAAGASSASATAALAAASEEEALQLPGASEWAALQPAVARKLYQFSYDHGARDVALALADYYFFGTGGVRANVPVAMGLYAVAAGNGNAQAAYNLGYLYEQGVGVAQPDDTRALMYYKKVMELSPPTSGMAHALPVYAAMARIHARRAIKDTPWLHSIVSFVPGLGALLSMPDEGAFAAAVPGGMVDEMHQRAAGTGASHLPQDPMPDATQTNKYIDAANNLAGSWVSRWVRSALAIAPQESEEELTGEAEESAQASLVDTIKHPKKALLRFLLEHGLPTVYVHYLWAVVAAVAVSGILVISLLFVIRTCKSSAPPTQPDVVDERVATGAVNPLVLAEPQGAAAEQGAAVGASELDLHAGASKAEEETVGGGSSPMSASTTDDAAISPTADE